MTDDTVIRTSKTKDEILESFRASITPIGRQPPFECPVEEVKVPLRWLAIATAELSARPASETYERPAIPELREIVENQAAGRQFLPVSMDLLRRVVSEPPVYLCPCGLTAAACRESACGESKQRHLHALPAAAICGAIVEGKLCQQPPSHEGECGSLKASEPHKLTCPALHGAACGCGAMSEGER